MSETISPVILNNLYLAARVRPQAQAGADDGGLSRSEAEYYSHCGRSVLEQKYALLQEDLDAAPPGTRQQAYLAKAAAGLRAIGLARGIFAPSAAPAPPDAAALKRDFEAAARRYLTATDESLKRQYAGDLYDLDGQAAECGVRGSELDDILARVCRETNCDLFGKDKVESMAQLSTLQAANVSPDGLPREVKEILIKTGYWQMVKENINLISLVRDLPPDNSGFAPGGTANPVLRRVEIDFLGKKEVRSPWKIAVALVHEAAHILWRPQPALLQNTTPDERQAYATVLEFLDAYERLYGTPKEPGERTAFLFDRLRAELAVGTANKLLGYAPDNYSVHETTLPTKALDLSYYPTGPDPSFLADRAGFDLFMAGLSPALDRPTAALLWEVLDGRAELTVSARVADGAARVRPRLTLHRLAGKLELTPRQVEQLADFFNQLPLSGQDKGRYHALVLGCSRPVAGARGQTGDFRISYASLRKKLYQASLSLQIEAAIK